MFIYVADIKVAVLDASRQRIVERVPAARKITIQDLFRHTSGLSYGFTGTTVVHKMYPASSEFACGNSAAAHGTSWAVRHSAPE